MLIDITIEGKLVALSTIKIIVYACMKLKCHYAYTSVETIRRMNVRAIHADQACEGR
jgi:hypothetical protein